jgi:hypothetical protein
MLKHLRLPGIPVSSCYFIALTWDMPEYAFHCCNTIPRDCLPVFLDEQGVDRFPESLDQVGWIGYRTLSEGLRLEENPDFTHALHMMVETTEPPPTLYDEARKGRWSSFPPGVVALADEIAHCFAVRAVRWEGSYSIQDENRQTIAKIIPNDTSVFLGIREGYLSPLAATGWSRNESMRKVRQVPFRGYVARDFGEAAPFLRALDDRFETPAVPADATGEPEAV